MGQAAVMGVAVILVAAGCGRSSPGSGGSSSGHISPSTGSATTTAGSTSSAPPSNTAAGSTSSTAPSTRAPDVFAEVSGGAVQLRSADTGAVVRTLVPAGNGAQTNIATGGRTFAVVGPSGRYVYYTDIAGAARVPLGGGAIEQLPTPPGAGDVTSVLADRSDTHFEETAGHVDDSKPPEVFVTRLGSKAVTDLGTGPAIKATGWNAADTTAYVTTTTATSPATRTQVADLGVTITGIPLGAPTTHGFRETLPSQAPGDDGACGPPSTATAIGPSGQIGWALGGCSSTSAGQLTYAFRIGKHYSLVQATFPADDQAFFAQSLQYTPAGTAVLLLTHQDCTGPDVVAVVPGNGDRGVDLPSSNRRCG